jgi:inorganic pyrophosphatase
MTVGKGYIVRGMIGTADPSTALFRGRPNNGIIEIPKGTRAKYELDKESGLLKLDRVLYSSVYYPANYGFIPQTYLPKEAGGDGDPVDIFVLGPYVPRESVLQVRLVGMIHMVDTGEEDSKLLAVRYGSSVMDVGSLMELEENYAGALDILRTWLQNYKGPGQVEVLSFGDQQEAWNYLVEAHKAYKNQKQ